MAKELVRLGDCVTLFTSGRDDWETTKDGVRVVQRAPQKEPEALVQGSKNCGITRESLEFSADVADSVKELNPEVLSLHYGLSGRDVSRLGIPYTYTFHVPDVMATFRRRVLGQEFSTYPVSVLELITELDVASGACARFALNRDMARYIERNLGWQCGVIPCGVDTSSFYSRGDEGYILYAGRFDWVKNIEVLLKAYSRLSAQARKGHHLRLVGSGVQEGAIRSLAVRLGVEDEVEVLPWMGREELRRQIAGCSFFVLPSSFETFSIVLIEAMASGKPVIASDIPGPRDVVVPGTTGFLFPWWSVPELAKCMSALIEAPERRRGMGAASRRRAVERYSFFSMASLYRTQFLRMLEGRRDVLTARPSDMSPKESLMP